MITGRPLRKNGDYRRDDRMKIIRIYEYGLESLRLARMNRQVQYDAEYQKVLKDFDGDEEWAESIMTLRRDPECVTGPALARGRPELKLIK
jgi:hypothetical protein